MGRTSSSILPYGRREVQDNSFACRSETIAEQKIESTVQGVKSRVENCRDSITCCRGGTIESCFRTDEDNRFKPVAAPQDIFSSFPLV
ncbi:hypothetical protein CCACVL1_25161 [Corchorus capsularis]|uniref:Uncharacterized protein n=1 Tax=Corchorus capsularis TaxID=210143 RepID=A0A1R3GLS0_COCAP|nr:hypothetical protein CCACVL1_25161 [Corchorus capsularis]